MRPPGSFKIHRPRRRIHDATAPALTERVSASEVGYEHALLAITQCEHRVQRIVDSLRAQITGAGPSQSLRIRQVFRTPREIYRVEIADPDLSYVRTTLLDRDALEELLEADEVRAALCPPRAGELDALAAGAGAVSEA